MVQATSSNDRSTGVVARPRFRGTFLATGRRPRVRTSQPRSWTPSTIRWVLATPHCLPRRAAAALALLLAGLPAHAQETIGTAALVRNEVTHGPAANSAPLEAGQAVVRREIVRTGADSVAKLVFLDQTNLSLGPRATIALDELVYRGEGSRGRVALDLTEGAFRFLSGKLRKESYEIVTPTATIGIRGTEFDVDARRTVTTVTLRAGQIRACSRGGGQCVVLTRPGDTAVITLAAAVRRRGDLQTAFSQSCSADPGLCSATTLAELPTGGAVVAALCGR